jgi:predicted regulator of Ras-like GTPase activity (Roadblock/LC7/MglB family)
MSIKEILLEMNSLSEVDGCLLCTSSGRIIAKDIARYASERQIGALSQKIVELIRLLQQKGEDFIEIPDAGNADRWAVKGFGNIVFAVLLYPDADLHLVKLQIDLAMDRLSKEKDVQKMIAQEFTILIAELKEVHVLDFLQFVDHLNREEFVKGIIITQRPFDDKVREELIKQGNRVEIVIAEHMKKERKKLIKNVEAQGFAIKRKALVTDRGM